jgi:hypothetical protein
VNVRLCECAQSVYARILLQILLCKIALNLTHKTEVQYIPVDMIKIFYYFSF